MYIRREARSVALNLYEKIQVVDRVFYIEMDPYISISSSIFTPKYFGMDLTWFVTIGNIGISSLTTLRNEFVI
jgi:hypothetical protein